MAASNGKKGNRKPSATPKTARVTKAPKKAAKTKTSLQVTDLQLNFSLAANHLAIWEWDSFTNNISWSANLHDILGLPQDGFDGTFETYVNLIHPADRDVYLGSLRDTLMTGKALQSVHRILWQNGFVRWVEMRGRISYQKGRHIKITGTAQDITNRKSTELDREDWKTRYELISASAGMVIYDYDIPSGNITWSGNSQVVLGYTPSDLGNIDTWIELIHPDDRVEAFRLLEEAQEELKAYDVFYRFRKASGDYCHMHDRGLFQADNHGVATRMLGMMSDVSEQVIAQQKILESNRYKESVESAMPGILYVFDNVNKIVVHANRSSLIFLGYGPQELMSMGKDFVQTIIHPDDHKKITRWFTEPDGSVKENEIRMRTRAGEYRWFMTRDTPFKRDANGQVIQIVGIAQDITIRKEALSQLNTSEQSYRQLFDTVTDAIFIQDQDRKLLDVNKGACDIYGYGKQEMIGRTPEFLIVQDEENIKVLRGKISQAFAGNPQTFELRCIKKNGEQFLQELMLTRGMYFGKTILIATGRDITQRRKSAEALKESEQRFRTLQEASFGGIGLHDKGVIIDCNQGLCNLTGYSYSELVGKNGLELIAPEWRDYVFEKIKGGYDKTYDVEGIRKDGSRYFLEIHGKNIPFNGNTIRVTEFRDITDRKRSEEKILEQNTRLKSLTDDLLRKNNQLEDFTQIVSHNLRAPVGNIVTLLSFLENASTDAERVEYVKLLKESSTTTLNMLNDINEVLKIKQNKNIEKENLSFNKVADHVVAMLNAKISSANAEIRFDFEVETISYPGVYLESIMLNLLDNALKYSKPDRRPIIEFKTYIDRAGHTVLEVSDNGLGINLQRYGHQMFKLRKTFHRHPESRGIGLFMIKNQVEAMGGEITVSSRENEGTTFYVNINKHHSDAT